MKSRTCVALVQVINPDVKSIIIKGSKLAKQVTTNANNQGYRYFKGLTEVIGKKLYVSTRFLCGVAFILGASFGFRYIIIIIYFPPYTRESVSRYSM